MSRNARDYLGQGGSPVITTEIFPKKGSDEAQLISFNARALPTSEAVGRSFRISSFTSPISISMI